MSSGERRICCAVMATCACAAGCKQRMTDQPVHRPLAASAFFPNDQSARPAIEGTVARGHLQLSDSLYRGLEAGKPVSAIPVQVTQATLERGQERYGIYCTPCHSALGNGDGMIVQRGFPRPPSFHIDRLREAPDGYFFQVISNGVGAMPTYASQVTAEDRWAIVAYVRALQLSQHATVEDVPPDRRGLLSAATGPASDSGAM